jgi:K+-transporting ATPase KdpF subunit
LGCWQVVSGCAESERLMLYVVAGVLCGLLLAYLFVALLKPEWFG